jgi:hypothetical protein
VLKIFMDETGIHEQASVVAVAGYIARPREWRAWTARWNAAKRPVKVFHAVDCANLRGEFEGWDKNQRDQFVANLLPLIPAHELAGIVIGINLHDLADVFKDKPELAEMLGIPYSACFQWAISIIMEIASERGRGEAMAFVHEMNDFRGEALKAFEYVRNFLNPRSIPITLKFGSKADHPPLQAADVLAYEGAKFLRNSAGAPRRAWTALDPDQSRLIVRRYAMNNMRELTSRLVALRERLLADGWDGTVV